jgi:iron complex outermembrane receptor protein
MKFIQLGFALLLAAVLFFCIPAQAQTGENTTSVQQAPYRLDRVIVRSHPMGETAMEITPDVTVINVDKFEKAGRIHHVQDLLSEIPGLDVMQSNITPSPSEQVYIRGLDQSRIQIFLDGKPMRLMGRMGYYKIDWTTMPIDNVESIEIIRGSHSLLYPFSMGGAINIITKKGKQTDDLKPDISVASEFGTYGAESHSANIHGGFSNAIGYAFALADRSGDGYLRNNDYNTTSFNSRISLFLPTHGTLTAGWDYVDNQTGYAVINDPDDPASDYDPDYPVVRADEIDTFTHDYEGKAYAGGDSYWEKTTNEYSLLFEQPLGPGDVEAQIYQHQSERNRFYYNANGEQNAQPGTEELNTGVYIKYLDCDLAQNHSFSIGGEYRAQGDDDNEDFYEILSAYFQDAWTISPALTLTWGIRYYEFRSDAYRAGFPGWGTFYQLSPEEQAKYEYRRVEKEWCPKARLNYELNPGLSLYASVSREMRTP